ncbi:adenylyl cyclase [Myceligenerans pegani]|uniref:Adenylyl cyclase n=1 Tax=Myceligenerans pegani TaxID=2776917 RepID=A0ABR9MW35_9MICO|nr:adenylyl cyclase [Myceligenerans sp. TRM 65318]MBE1875595.1 adenylyl cyclase [Myceligenerans sp. TRM 65318]MBE3017866.1 adenylyl cyclase [Myceligenerans sp. TRM 65318]
MTPHSPRARRRVGAGITAALIAGGVVAALPTSVAAHPRDHGAPAGDPDFGPNVTFIDETWSTDEINEFLDSVNDEPEFSQDRHQVFFEPGVYGSAAGEDDPATAEGIINAELGYYESVDGLGAVPGDVLINGAIHVEPHVECPDTPWACQGPGSLTRFWRSMANLGFNPIQRPTAEDAERPFPAGVAEPHQMRYAVSQAAPLRRVDVRGDLTVFGRFGEYASGGYLANSRVEGTITTGSQQQWYTRDSEVGTWDGGVWNMVFSGVDGAPATDFGQPAGNDAVGVKTSLGTTPVTREKPFLYRADDGELRVFAPHARTGTSGVNWSTDAAAGDSLRLDDFYIARAERDTAASINRKLRQGKHLILTPGVYELNRPLRVTRPDTVVLGLGYASLTPTRGNAALVTGDAPGIHVAGITVDANVPESEVLVQVGKKCPPSWAKGRGHGHGHGHGHAHLGHHRDGDDPITLTDVFVRVGGPWVGKAVTSIEVNSDDVLLDHIWAWRGDHGNGIGWEDNTGAHGVVVNGDHVTATGLFVEHYQENQTVWNGEDGLTVFYQSELPYDPPSQEAWTDGDRLGYASYRVADHVRRHEAVGLGVYSYFWNGVDIRTESGIQVPETPGVTLRSMTSVFLNGSGGINHVINTTGAPAVGSFASPQVIAYPTS